MPGRTAVGARLRCASRDRAEEAWSERKGHACHPWRDLALLCAAETACRSPAARIGSDVCDGSLLSVLSVGRIFLHPISGSAVGWLDRPPLVSQLVHSFET